MTRFLLASASPRRRELLTRLGFDFDVRPADVDETLGESTKPQVVAHRLAKMKAEAARLLEEHFPIIAADTVVALDGKLLGKPEDADEARRMLHSLGGRIHEVVTAVVLMPANKRSVLARQPITHVTMHDLTEAEIDDWIARGGPFDKAGAYSIQDEIFRPVSNYDGCYCNVVGLPLWPLLEMLRKTGITLNVIPERMLPQCATCPLAPK